MQSSTTDIHTHEENRHRELSVNEVKTLALTAIGGALEYFDFIVAVFFAKILASVFFPPETPPWLSQLSVFAVLAAGYLVRPLGGLVFAHFGDLFGRKKIFALSLFLMVAPTFVMGILPGYSEIGLIAPLLLLVCRVLQGLSVGGEIPGSFIYCSEHVSKKRIGVACGMIMAGFTVGILMGALSATWLHASLTPKELNSWGWRIPFIAGGVAGFIAVYLRRYLEESPVFKNLSAHKTNDMPLKVVLRDYKAVVLIGSLCTWFFCCVFVIYFLYLPTYLQTQWQMPARATFAANSWATAFVLVGCIATGMAIDRIGWAKTWAIGAIGTAVTTSLFFYQLMQNSPDALTYYIVGGFFVGSITVVPFILTTSFPARVRFTGFSLSFNVSYAIFGGTAPVVMAALVGGEKMLLAPAGYIIGLCLMAVILSATWRKPDCSSQ
jgi:MFS family permease